MGLTNKELAQKIDELPDKLVRRLDDRYYKKGEVDDKFISADKIYVKKETVAIVGSVLSLFMMILGGIGGYIIQLWIGLNGGR